MSFTTDLSLSPPNAHLVATGELDACTASGLRTLLEGAVDSGCHSFTVDLAGLQFVDAAGLGRLVWLANRLSPFGGRIVITSASDRFRWVADVAGLGGAFGLPDLPDRPLS